MEPAQFIDVSIGYRRFFGLWEENEECTSFKPSFSALETKRKSISGIVVVL